jgi:2-polyprenyl-3-methyl-5-hydroxy-6-metoxy-1,4-benzoquinol methylase
MELMETIGTENTSRLVDAVCAEWPAHEKTARKSLADRSADVLRTTELLATQILRLCGGRAEEIEKLARDYRFTCEKILLPEELHFRRTESYRLSRFEDAEREVYADAGLMGPYLNGLLLSYVMWANHACAIDHYLRQFLPQTPAGARHLEIGPGHGLLLYHACLSPSIKSVSGWDVSRESVDSTAKALAELGAPKPVRLEQRNILQLAPADDAGLYDNIVLSEILEHLEDPVAALTSLRSVLKPGGRVWISIPANSPAPDHLFLVRSPEHACELVTQAGLEVVDSHAFPTAGATVEKALARKLSISCVITAVG